MYNRSFINLYNFTFELKILLLLFLIILLLPIIGIFILTQEGFSKVSNYLVNNTAHSIRLNYPDGKLYKIINIQTVWPLHGITTLEFGQNDFPYQPFHTGIDIAGPFGFQIICAMSGKVVYAGEISWGYGKHVIVNNDNNIQTVYAHLDSIAVKNGDECITGKTVIGTEGQTGWATGPHLHFEIDLWGIPVNPRNFIYGNP